MPGEGSKTVDHVVQAVQDKIPRKWRNLGLEGVDVIFGRRPKIQRRSSFDLTGAVADKLRPKVPGCQCTAVTVPGAINRTLER